MADENDPSTSDRTSGRSRLRGELSDIVHGINETSPTQTHLTSPSYARTTGARMYEHTNLEPLKNGIRGMFSGRPSKNSQTPMDPHDGQVRDVRTRPKAQAGMGGPPGMSYSSTASELMLARSGVAALGPGQVAPRAGSLGQGRPMQSFSAPSPMLELPAGPQPTPAQRSRGMSRSDRQDPGKQAMGRALSGSLGDTIPPQGEKPWFSR